MGARGGGWGRSGSPTGQVLLREALELCEDVVDGGVEVLDIAVDAVQLLGLDVVEDSAVRDDCGVEAAHTAPQAGHVLVQSLGS